MKLNIKKVWLEYKYIFLLFIALNITYSLIAYLAGSTLKYDPTYAKVSAIGSKLIDVWTRWDGMQYLDIAKRGYGRYSQYNVAFFPLYPLLIYIMSKLTGIGHVICSLIIARGSMLLMMISFYKLVKLDFDRDTALRAVLYICVFPTGFYFLAAYTESIFLLFILLSFYYARRSKWLPACLFAMLSTATRSVGIFMVIALLYEYLKQKDFKSVKLDILYLGLVPAGIVAYMIYLYYYNGDPLAFKSAEAGFHRHLLVPGVAFWYSIQKMMHYESRLQAFREVLLSIPFLFMLYPCFKKLRLSYVIFMLPAFLLPFSTTVVKEGLSSMPRYVLVLFPAFIYLALLGKKKIFNDSYIIFSSVFGGLLLSMYACWYWVA